MGGKSGRVKAILRMILIEIVDSGRLASRGFANTAAFSPDSFQPVGCLFGRRLIFAGPDKSTNAGISGGSKKLCLGLSFVIPLGTSA